MSALRRRTKCITWSMMVGAGLALGIRQGLAEEPAAKAYVVSVASQPIYALQDGKLLARILIDEASVGATAASMTMLTASPGANAPEHSHDGDELVYVIAGHAITRLAGATHELSEGMAMRIPRGMAHELFVPQQDSPLEVLVIYAIPGAEQRFKAGEMVTPEAP